MAAIENGEVRVAAIYPIHLLGDPEYPPEWMELIVDNCTDSDLAGIFEGFDELSSLTLDDANISSEQLGKDIALRWIWAKRKGFLVYVEIVKRVYQSKNSWYGGWGMSHLRWLYLTDLSELPEKVDQLADAEHEHALQTYLKKAASS